jgi:hypothetical protein
VLGPDGREVSREVAADDGRQHGDAVLVALAAPHGDLVAGEVDILDAEAAAFEDAEAGAVEEAGHEPGGAGEALEH